MAVMTEQQRDDANRKMIQQMFVQAGATANLTTVDCRILVNAADDFLDTNAAAFNLTIPLEQRTKATPAQKAMAIAYAALKRAGVI